MSEPRIYSCAEWGAVPRSTSSLQRKPVAGVTIHHTASPITTPLQDASAERARCFLLARSFQQSHRKRGWIDSGHHFLVCSSGLILEGRHGSLAAARQGLVIRGAHAGDDTANRTTWGIETEGLFTHALPNAAQWAAVVELCSWLCLWGEVQSQNIEGHRIYKATECPGALFFMKLPDLRREVHDRKTMLMAEGDNQ